MKELDHLLFISGNILSIFSQTIEGLLGDRSSCTRLSHLDLSYNDVSNSFAANSLSSFLNVCPNLKRLNLSSCGLSAVALPCLLDVFKGKCMYSFLA